MATKEELIHDINIVTSLSSKQDMSLASNAQRCLKLFEQKRYFKSDLEKLYIERLKQIADGSNLHNCFVCRKNRAYDGLLCEECMQKYTRGVRKFYKKTESDVLLALDEAFEENIQETRSASDSIKNEKFPNNSLANNPLDISNNGQSKSDLPEWKKYSRMSIIAVVLSLFPLFPIGLVLALIDLSKKDGRKRGNSIAALIISCIWIVAITGISIYDNIPKFQANTSAGANTDYSYSNGLNFAQHDVTSSQFNESFLEIAYKLGSSAPEYDILCDLSINKIGNGIYDINCKNTKIARLLYGYSQDNSDEVIYGVLLSITNSQKYFCLLYPFFHAITGDIDETVDLLTALSNSSNTTDKYLQYDSLRIESYIIGPATEVRITSESKTKTNNSGDTSYDTRDVIHTGEEAIFYNYDNDMRSEEVKTNSKDVDGLNQYAYSDEEIESLLK